MASNVLVFTGGAGNLVRYNGGFIPLALEAFSAAAATDLLMTVGAAASTGPTDNRVFLGDSGQVLAVVKASAVVLATDLVCKVNETTLVQLVDAEAKEPVFVTPIQKQNL